VARQSGNQQPEGLQKVSDGIHDLQSSQRLLEAAKAQLERIDTRRIY